MKVKPLNDRILVKIEELEGKTKSGIYIPETARDNSILEGVVLATGEGRWDEDGKKRVPVEVRKNDRVLLGKYAGNEFKIEGVEHRIVREEDVLGVVEK
jgi:chaperonin GroES